MGLSQTCHIRPAGLCTTVDGWRCSGMTRQDRSIQEGQQGSKIRVKVAVGARFGVRFRIRVLTTPGWTADQLQGAQGRQCGCGFQQLTLPADRASRIALAARICQPRQSPQARQR